jgi:hypothetical protein
MTLAAEQAERLDLEFYVTSARWAFDLPAYEAFHWLVFHHVLMEHEKRNLGAYFDEWAKEKATGAKGVLNKAARGLFKSTDSDGFLLFTIGHFPWLSHLIVQARDDDAQKTGGFIADTIESNAGWKQVFPSVVPDKERGWSQNGYHVKDTSVSYDEWVQRCMGDHKRDPSFMSVSVQAGAIGSHPTGILLMDDIHDSKNTLSLAEMDKAQKIVKADIIPTMNRPGRKPMMVVAYTPWKPDDTYALLERTGIFTQLVTPAFRELSEDEFDPANPKHAHFDGRAVDLTCPEVYPVAVLEQQMRLLGKREFARQLLCNLEVGKGESLTYYPYIPTGSEWELPVAGGADPTTTEPDRYEEGKKRSYFALAFVAKLPQGGAVVLDGILEQCSHTDALNYLLGAQSRFPHYMFTMVENAGVGAAFFQLARRDLRLRVVESDLKLLETDKGVKSKDDRILQMSKWMEDGTIKIAARDTPFLNALRYLFEHFWELRKNDPNKAWDAGDATYQALKAFPELLISQQIPTTLPERGQAKRMGLGSAWNSIGT